MNDLVRLSFSIEEDLRDKLSYLVNEKGYKNRSEFIRDMIREKLVQEEWEDKAKEVVGTITLIYDHHQRELSNKLTDLQHSFHNIVLCSSHVHLTEKICAEMIMVKGKTEYVKQLANNLGQQRGVLNSALKIATTDMQIN